MSGPTTVQPVTARLFLAGSDPGADPAEALGRTLSEHGVAGSALQGARQLSASAVRAVDREIGAVAAGLLELDLGDMLVMGWRKYRMLIESANRTLASPGVTEMVALATHRVTATYSPSVDLFVDSVRVNSFEFTLTVGFDLTGVNAVVRWGDLVALRGGECLVTATLALEGARLAERQSRVDLAWMVPLRPAVPLVDKSATAQGVPRQPTGPEAASQPHDSAPHS